MPRNVNRKKRSNSFNLKKHSNNLHEENTNINISLMNKNKKEMLSYKFIHNLDLTTYDYIFMDRKINNETLHNFDSFKELLNNIKKKFNPKILQNNADIENIKKEGKFSFNNNNLTELLLINNIKDNEIEISINNKYIKTNANNLMQFFNIYATKSFFKGKHCFEIEILNINEIELSVGIINISYLNFYKGNLNKLIFHDSSNIFIYKLEKPFFIQKDKEIYNHYITYGDILGFCYDLDQKIFYLFLNGEIVNTEILTIDLDSNNSYVPYINIGINTEIIFNPGDNLKYMKEYIKYGFIPLDESGKNNIEISNLKYVTDTYLDILVNHGKLIIQNNNITYSDINQIFHIIFNFLGNYSFEESYIIYNSIIKKFFLEKNKEKLLDTKTFEIYYICLKFILNSTPKRKLIIKNIFLNIAEAIHIISRRGDISYTTPMNNLVTLLAFLFTKEDIQNILYKLSKTLKKIFTSIFISFNAYNQIFHNNYLDFIMKPKIDTKLNNDINSFFPNIILSKEKFKNLILYNEFLNNKIKKSGEYYLMQILKNIYHNGTDNQSNILFNIFKKYLKEMNKISLKEEKKVCNLFKNIFVPLMNSFNNQYQKEERETISIKKYLRKNEKDGEKLGGTVNFLYEEYSKEIPNFENLLNYCINDYNNIFLLEFISLFFIKKYTFWNILELIIIKSKQYVNTVFSRQDEIKDIKSIHSILIKYLNYKIFSLSMNDLYIFVQFLYNISDFFLNELYPKKLIYFLPETIFNKLENIINICIQISDVSELSKKYFSEIKSDSEEIKNYISESLLLNINIKELCYKCCNQYISIYIKIIEDKNIKKPSIKCNFIYYLRNIIYLDKYFFDNDLYSIFNFIYFVNNKSEYKLSSIYFMGLFDNNMTLQENNYYSFGQRLNKIISKNINFLKILIILLYNNIDKSLTQLEEAFSEYKFIPRSSSQNENNIIESINHNNLNNQNIVFSRDNNIIIYNNNFNNNNNDLINLNDLETINRAINLGIPGGGRRVVVISEIGNDDRNKLFNLKQSLNKSQSEFLKLINFYKLTSKIKILYQLNTFESKKLYNLILSLNNLIFSQNNIIKIENNNDNDNSDNINLIESYSNLLEIINEFYNTLINNIIEINDINLLKEISKQINIIHLKEILQIFEKFNPVNDENDYKIMKNFIIKLEELKSVEEEIKQNKNEIINDNNSDENNICPICSDSIIDSHLLPCYHAICINCLYQHLFENKFCPFCREEIKGIKEDPNFKVYN